MEVDKKMEKDWYEYPLCTDAHYYYYKVEYFYNNRLLYTVFGRSLDNNIVYKHKKDFLKNLYDYLDFLVPQDYYKNVEIAISYFTKEGYCKGGIYIK
jgi:hypothetical protein